MIFKYVLQNKDVGLKLTSRWRWRFHAWSRNFCSTGVAQESETLSLRVGGSGHVDLHLFNSCQLSKHNKILLHLPPGHLPDEYPNRTQSLTAQTLADQFKDVTVIDIRFRLGPRNALSELDYRFPVPIHDLYTAWDFVKDQLSEHIGVDTPSTGPTKICVFGSHIGGALALSLGLTNPDDIHAIVIQDPLVDWPGLDEIVDYNKKKQKTGNRKQSKRDVQAAAAQALVRLRARLFRSPSGYFDPFASPILFLRAPGHDVPLTMTSGLADPHLGGVRGTSVGYGEDDDEAGVVAYNEEAFGPYDDEWHAAETTKRRPINDSNDLEDNSSVLTESSLDSRDRSLETDSSEEKHAASLTSPKDTSEISQRRRKVLRRWPQTAQPQEVILPFVHIILDKSTIGKAAVTDNWRSDDILHVTQLHGEELSELLRKACFWGREKSFAEERVTLTQVDEQQGQELVCQWLQLRLNNAL